MSRRKILILAVLAGLAVALVPELLPAGPGPLLDPSAFLSSGRWLAGVSIVFLGGLLTAMTPCVYPLIPITVGIFGARKSESRSKSVLLTSAYILGMGLVFSVLGVVAAETGRAFGSLLGDPRVVVGLSIFLLILASSMFGAFELALPSGMMQRLNAVGSAGVAGAFLMGSVSGFLAAPCTGPVLTALLAFVAKTQSLFLGGSLLFIYAMGIGVPFFLIGVFALRLPKGGMWMEWVKSLLGIALVALAASYLRDAFGPLRQVFSHLAEAMGRAPGAWIAALVAAVGIGIGAVHRSFKGSAWEASVKGFGVLLVAAAILLRGTALNAPPSGEMWRGLCAGHFRDANQRLVSHLADAFWVKVCLAETNGTAGMRWDAIFPVGSAPMKDVRATLEKSRQGRPVLIDFFAEWCAACKELDRHTYSDPSVIQEVNGRFLTVKIDGTNDREDVDALYQQFGVQALPTVAFISSDGEILDAPRVTGFLDPDKFLAELKKVR